MRLRSRNRLALFTMLLTCSPFLAGQSSKNPFYLHDGDTVVFYGDSITEQRYYTQSVEVYTVTRFPHMRVQFFNAGVGGDSVSGGSAGPIDLRLTRDIFPQKPTVVTIMLGMNDGGYGPLTPKIETKYAQGYEHILNSIQQTIPGVRLSLLGPSPYDEITRPEIFSGGYNSTLTRFAEIDRELARKHGATFIDLNAPFVASLKKGLAIDPLATELLLPDRVHPEPMAHWFMAEAILKGWNAPSIVSSTTIDAKKLVATDTVNSHVTELVRSPGKDAVLVWTELDDALPLPLDNKNEGNHFLRRISNIDQDLDQQLLTVQGLDPGSYLLTIDGRPVGTFADADFAKGINLADWNTPMRGQAYTVNWLIRDRDDAHYVRLRMFANELKTGASAEPGASDISRFEQALQERIYDEALPLPHQYRIAPVENPR